MEKHPERQSPFTRLIVMIQGQAVAECALLLGLVVFAIWLLVSPQSLGQHLSSLYNRITNEVAQIGVPGCGGGGGGGGTGGGGGGGCGGGGGGGTGGGGTGGGGSGGGGGTGGGSGGGT